MNCELNEETLSAFVDGELRPGEHSAAAAHIAECPRCSGTIGMVRGVKDSLSELPPPAMPQDLKDRLLAEARRIDLAAAAAEERTDIMTGLQDAFIWAAGSWPGRLALSGTAVTAAVLFFILSGPVEPVIMPLDVILSAHNEFARDILTRVGEIHE